MLPPILVHRTKAMAAYYCAKTVLPSTTTLQSADSYFRGAIEGPRPTLGIYPGYRSTPIHFTVTGPMVH